MCHCSIFPDGESSDVAATPVAACVLIHEHALRTVRNRESVVSMIKSFRHEDQLQLTVVGSKETTALTASVINGTESFIEAILERAPSDANGPELSATFLNKGLERCFSEPPTVARPLAKILIIIGTSDTDVVGDNGPLLSKKIKTIVVNVTPGSPMLPTFTSLATDAEHVIDITDLPTLQTIRQFGMFSVTRCIFSFILS